MRSIMASAGDRVVLIEIEPGEHGLPLYRRQLLGVRGSIGGNRRPLDLALSWTRGPSSWAIHHAARSGRSRMMRARFALPYLKLVRVALVLSLHVPSLRLIVAGGGECDPLSKTGACQLRWLHVSPHTNTAARLARRSAPRTWAAASALGPRFHGTSAEDSYVRGRTPPGRSTAPRLPRRARHAPR